MLQRPSLRGLFLESLIFGGAYLRREICISKLTGLALQVEVNFMFLLCFTLYLRVIFQVQPPGGLYLEGRCNGGFLPLPVWGAYIWRGSYMEGLILGILRQLRNFQQLCLLTLRRNIQDIYLLCVQLGPSQPSAQTQVYDSIPSRQLAPFLQLWLRQLSIS